MFYSSFICLGLFLLTSLDYLTNPQEGKNLLGLQPTREELYLIELGVCVCVCVCVCIGFPDDSEVICLPMHKAQETWVRYLGWKVPLE